MVKFLHLSPKSSEGLDKPIFKNAQKLYKDAILIAETNKSYSTSASLLILSSEEVVKAVLVLLHSNEYKVYEIEGAKKFFVDHKIRHQIAQLIESGLGLFESMMIWGEERKKKVIETKYKLFNDAVHLLKDFYKASQPMFKTADRVEKLQEFNNLKNKGLYVDYRDELLDPKVIITEEAYKEINLIVKRTFKFYKILKIFFHESLEKHIPKSKIDEGKESLKFFIDEAMKDFSFKN